MAQSAIFAWIVNFSAKRQIFSRFDKTLQIAFWMLQGCRYWLGLRRLCGDWCNNWWMTSCEKQKSAFSQVSGWAKRRKCAKQCVFEVFMSIVAFSIPMGGLSFMPACFGKIAWLSFSMPQATKFKWKTMAYSSGFCLTQRQWFDACILPHILWEGDRASIWHRHLPGTLHSNRATQKFLVLTLSGS